MRLTIIIFLMIVGSAFLAQGMALPRSHYDRVHLSRRSIEFPLNSINFEFTKMLKREIIHGSSNPEINLNSIDQPEHIHGNSNGTNQQIKDSQIVEDKSIDNDHQEQQQSEVLFQKRTPKGFGKKLLGGLKATARFGGGMLGAAIA